MAILLFRLNGVPDDEADEVRELLTQHGLPCYETDAGRWGISVAAIWLTDESRADEARGLIEDYQRQRETRLRSEYEQRKAEGGVESLADRLRREPLRVIFYVALIVAVLYLTLQPFLQLR